MSTVGQREVSATSPGDGGLVPPPPATAATFPALDTLRAVGAFCVVTTHVAFWAGDYTRHGTMGTILARLDVGVALFFVLSGFLLSRGWLQNAAEHRPAPATGAYLWRRLLRIAPVYVVAVVLALSLVEANRDIGPGHWVTTLLMLDTLRDSGFPDGLTQMWSLSVEVSFYLLLPLLMAALLGRRPGRLPVRRVLVGLAVVVAISVWWHLDGAARIGQGRPLEWLPAYGTWFAVGIALALVEVLVSRGAGGRAARALVSLGRQPGVCWALAGGLLLVAATPLAGPTMFAAPTAAESLTKHLLYAAIGGCLVLTGVFARPGSTYAAVMGHPVGRRLGWISYGVFCLHLPLLHFTMWATGWDLFAGRGVAIWALAVVLSLLAAELAYRVVERPALRLKDLPLRRAASTTPTTGTSAR